MNTLASDQLKNILIDPYGYSSNHKYVTVIKDGELDTFTVVLDNVEIIAPIQIPNNVSYGYNLKFSNKSSIGQIYFGRFDHLTIEDSFVERIHLSGAADGRVKSISLINNSTIEYLNLEHDAKLELVKIDDYSKVNFSIINLKSQINNITISNNSHLRHLDLKNSQINEIRCEYYSKCESIICSENSKILIVDNSYFGIINKIVAIKDSSINKLLLREKSISGNINIHYDSKIETIEAYWSSKVGDLNIGGNVIKADISSNISKLKIGTLNLDNIIKISSSCIQELNILKSSIGKINLYIQDSEIAKLSISNSFLNNNDIISINNSGVHILELKQLKNLGSIIISGLRKLKEWNFELRDKNDNVIVTEIEPQLIESLKSNEFFNEFDSTSSSFIVIASDLGNTSFINCDFDLFSNFNFSNSKILDCFLGDVKLPSLNKFLSEMNIHNKILNSAHVEEHKRLFFGQIKSIYYKQGDFSRGSIAQSKELESFRNQLNFEYELYKVYWYNWERSIVKEKEFINRIKDMLVLI